MTQPPSYRHPHRHEISQADQSESKATSLKSDQSITDMNTSGIPMSPVLPSKISASKPLTLGSLRIVPLTSNRKSRKKPVVKMGVRELDKATVELREVDAGGQVPVLYAENRTKHYVLFIEGDQLIGAKQNRICNSTVLLRPKSQIQIPVSCVEEGRWTHISRNFSSSKFHASPKLRRQIAKTKETTRQHTDGRQAHSASQSQVWQHIIGFASQAGVNSQTMAMEDVYQARDQQFHEQLRNEHTVELGSTIIRDLSFACPKGSNGWILESPDGDISIDIFGTPKLCRWAWERIIRSAAIEATVYKKRVPAKSKPKFSLNNPKSIKKLLTSIQKSPLEKVIPVAAGVEQRFLNPNINGAYLTLDNRLVHLGLTV